jgi:hypothetical protein
MGGHAVKVFLSYRRGEAGGYAGRLADTLRQRLGARSVFQDVAAITPGQDFTSAIDRALDECDAVLTIIGPGWLAAATPQAAPRLFDADDYVRLELTRALHRNVPVVPVLVGGAALPTATALPEELKGLVHRQAVVLHDETWHQDVDGLVRSLRGGPAAPATRRPRWLVTGAAVAVALVGVVAGALWWWGRDTDQGTGGGGAPAGSAGEIAACAPPRGQGWSPIALGSDPTGAERLDDGSLVFKVKDAHWRERGGRWQVTLATSMENATSAEKYQGVWRFQSLIVGQREFKATCYSSTPDLVDAGTVGDALIGFEVSCKPVGYIQLVVEDGKARISVTDDTLEPGAC